MLGKGRVGMVDSVPVTVDGVAFEVAVVDVAKVGPVGITEAFDFDAVRATIEAVAGQFTRVWERVRPDEATVEFGVSVKAKSGKLTSLIVEGEGEGTFKVTMTWKAPPASTAADTSDRGSSTA